MSCFRRAFFQLLPDFLPLHPQPLLHLPTVNPIKKHLSQRSNKKKAGGRKIDHAAISPSDRGKEYNHLCGTSMPKSLRYLEGHTLCKIYEDCS